MRKELFSKSDSDSGLNLIVISYFDRIYEDGYFIRMLELFSKGVTMSTDGAYCHLPNMDSLDESEHFEGVEFAIGYPPLEEDTVIVSKEICYKYVQLASERYIKLHPDKASLVNQILSGVLY